MFWLLLVVARAIPWECVCTVADASLNKWGNEVEFLGCGAHMVKAKWCNVMDPEACKQKDCDPCDDPDDCPDLAYAKPCDGGVHVFNRYVINSRPEHFWKYLGCKRVVVFSPDSYFCSLLCRTFSPKR